MSRNSKILLIVLAIPVALVLVGAIALKLYFTSDRLKALIIPEVEKATNRKVTVGETSLSLFPTFGVSLENLTISAPQGARFESDEFLSLEELVIDVNLFALIKSRLEIDEIVLRSPRLYLEVTQDGLANYAQPSKAEETRPSAGSGAQPSDPLAEAGRPGGPSMGLLLSDFKVIDGEVVYVDKQADRRIIITDYDQTMRAKISDDGSDVFLESESSVGGLSYGSLKGFLISNLPVKTYQRLTYNRTKDLLSLDSTSIGIREIILLVKGTVEHTQTKPILNLSISSTKADLSQLLSLVPKDYMKAAEGLSSSGTFQFAMEVKGESSDSSRPGVRGTFAVANGSIRYASLPKAISNITASGAFEQPPTIRMRTQPGRFSLEKFSANLGSSVMAGRLGFVDFENPVLSASFDGKLKLNEVKEYYPLEQGTELMGSLRASFSISGKARVPASLKADGRLEFQNVTTKTATSPKPLQNLSGVITFNNQLIDSKRLSMNIGESDMMLAFTMRNYLALVMEDAAEAGKPAMLATLTSKRLRTADLMADEPETEPAPVGKPAKAGQGTKGTVEQTALFPNMDVDANVSIDKLETEKFEFANARGSVKIRNGVITLQNFSLNAFQGNVVTKGVLDVRRTDRRPFDLNLEITGVQANAMLPKFTSFGNNLFGKFSMNTSIKGDLNDTLGLDTKTLSGQGTAQIFDGRLVGYPLTMKLANYTGISELREVHFKDWSNNFTISDGKVNIRDLRVAAVNSDFVVNGSQGFDGSLDYKMLVRLPESMSNRLRISGLGGEMIDFLKDKEGRINLIFKVTGASSDPVFGLDTEEAKQRAKQALEQKAKAEAQRLSEEAKKKVEEELKKKAEEGLKKLFKRP